MFSTGLSEIVLIVKDVRASAYFYRKVVGLTPETEANDDSKNGSLKYAKKEIQSFYHFDSDPVKFCYGEFDSGSE